MVFMPKGPHSSRAERDFENNQIQTSHFVARGHRGDDDLSRKGWEKKKEKRVYGSIMK